MIAVIAILAALLLPALSRAKAQAYSIKCRSNLHQLGLQLAIYVNDYHTYPLSDYVMTNIVGARELLRFSGGTAQLHEQEEQGIKRCPIRVYPPFTGAPPLFISGFTSYGYNHLGYRGPTGVPLSSNLGLGGRIGREPSCKGK